MTVSGRHGNPIHPNIAGSCGTDEITPKQQRDRIQRDSFVCPATTRKGRSAVTNAESNPMTVSGRHGNPIHPNIAN